MSAPIPIVSPDDQKVTFIGASLFVGGTAAAVWRATGRTLPAHRRAAPRRGHTMS